MRFFFKDVTIFDVILLFSNYILFFTVPMWDCKLNLTIFRLKSFIQLKQNHLFYWNHKYEAIQNIPKYSSDSLDLTMPFSHCCHAKYLHTVGLAIDFDHVIYHWRQENQCHFHGHRPVCKVINYAAAVVVTDYGIHLGDSGKHCVVGDHNSPGGGGDRVVMTRHTVWRGSDRVT